MSLQFINYNLIDEEAKFLFQRKKYKESANLLIRFLKNTNDPNTLNRIYTNLRMCYFFANDVASALDILEKQEKLPLQCDWTLKRDKANYLRYMNRHDEAYEIVKTIEDKGTRYLAWSWFEHKKGNIKVGFDLTELSRKNNGYWLLKFPEYEHSFWDGEQVNNIAILSESGFGDQIIFSRWIPKLKYFCNNIFYDGKELSKTFCRNFNINDIDEWNNSEKIHVVPIMSLAYHLGIENPNPKKYLTADENITNYYNKKFPKNKIRIGLCVQGDKTHIETALRTLPLKETVDSLVKHGEVINLEKDFSDIDSRIKYIPFETWEDTFSLIGTCDIIVTCDTGVAHAAASIGKTTIVLMHAAAYFTWNHNNDISKTIWYENAWCIHQDKPCDWTGAIEKCSELITQLMKEI